MPCPPPRNSGPQEVMNLPSPSNTTTPLGLPLAGFTSKWQIFVAGFRVGAPWAGWLVAFAALNSVLSLTYYAPLVNAVYRREPSQAVQEGGRLSWAMSLPLALLGLAVVAIGVWPNLMTWLTAPAGEALARAFGG